MNSLNKHLIRYAEMQYSRAAFVDARTPGSHLKENYCLVGKGVSQSTTQPVHIMETDGFHVGAAGQPPGILNSLHSHFTAEIFMVFKGQFRIFWGDKGQEEAVLQEGDIISVPINSFRGFEVIGEKSGFLFAVLGHDDCGGGIVWHPSAILEGRKYGLFLKKDGTLADTVAGDPEPEDVDLYPLLSDEEIARFKNYSFKEMSEYLTRWPYKNNVMNEFSKAGDFKYHQIIGAPDDPEDFKIKSKDDLSIFGYEIEEGGTVPMHKRKEKQVLINFKGDVLITFDGSDSKSIFLGPGDVFDMPKGMAFSLKGLRGTSFTYVVVNKDNLQLPELY